MSYSIGSERGSTLSYQYPERTQIANDYPNGLNLNDPEQQKQAIKLFMFGDNGFYPTDLNNSLPKDNSYLNPAQTAGIFANAFAGDDKILSAKEISDGYEFIDQMWTSTPDQTISGNDVSTALDDLSFGMSGNGTNVAYNYNLFLNKNQNETI